MFLQGVLMLIFALPPLLSAAYFFINSTFVSVELPLLSILSLSTPVSFLLDWTSMMFLFTVMFISSMILMFSTEYIPPSDQGQFSLLLLSFVLSMSLLILSDSIIFMLLGWDGLGLTSFVLVIFYQNASSSASGAITIFSNRVGDIFILLSIAFLTMSGVWNFSSNEQFPTMILLLLLLAACSKSAQFPFSAWLPAAMAAPTPISALVHSSTLVTAGVYLLIRVMNNPHPTTMACLLMISSMTAIYASMSANWEMDMKKIIALSTLSQIAMMMFAISLGAVALAFMHLIIHALFKSMMFLCAGMIIRTSTYQDMRFMGTNLKNYPLVYSTLGVASLSLMGIPFMSGFFSKDPIIETVILSKTFSFMSILMILSIGMTASYSFRLISLATKFSLKSKPDIMAHPANMMEIPIILMAPLSIFMGSFMLWVSTPEQLILIPSKLKYCIILTLTMGAITGISLSFSSSMYKKLGQTAISLWFNHFITTSVSPPLSPMMSTLLSNDKTWQEIYGPNHTFWYTSYLSSNPDVPPTQLLFIVLLLTLYPMLVIPY